MEGPRAPAVTEYPEILSFLDKSLRPDHTWSIAAEYPTALQQTNMHNIRIIKDGQEVLSHAVLKPLILKSPIAIYKIAAIGSVVTSSNHRKLGLSSQIIEACLNEAIAQNCDLAVLWTDLFDFYRKFGFEVTGSELSILIDHALPTRMQGITIREGSNVDPAAILKLYNRHTVGTVRTQEEIRQFLKIPNSKFYTCWDSKGMLLAYAAEGKGADLNGYIHEWGGGVTEVMNLVDEIRIRQNRNLTLIAPAHAVNIADRYRQLEYKIHEGFLGMIKIVNFDQLAAKILRHARHDYGASQFILEKSKDGYLIGTHDQKIELFNDSSLIRLLFGPQRPSELLKLDSGLSATLDRILPLRLWFWGWDSI
jgi:predicted GNAT family N-acyltransferase